MFRPKNEQGTVVLFTQVCEQHGWTIIDVRTAYPDAVIENGGEQWLAEFEFKSSSFISHGHDIRECEIIVCWINDYIDCPLPIIELSSSLGWVDPKKSEKVLLEIEYWKRRALVAETRLQSLRNNGSFDDDYKDQRTDYEQSVIDYYRDNPLASQRDAAYVTGISQPKISRVLSALESSGVIHRNGNGVEVLE